MESKLFNKYIFFFIIFLGLLYFVSLDSFAATNTYTVPKGESVDFIVTERTFTQPTSTVLSWECPVTTVTMWASCSPTYSANFVSYSLEGHIVTSVGDFVVVSVFSYNSADSNKTETVTVMGYPVSFYYVLKATAKAYTSNNGNISVGFYNSTNDLNWSCTNSSGLSATLNSLQSDTRTIIDKLNDMNITVNDSNYAVFDCDTTIDGVTYSKGSAIKDIPISAFSSLSKIFTHPYSSCYGLVVVSGSSSSIKTVNTRFRFRSFSSSGNIQSIGSLSRSYVYLNGVYNYILYGKYTCTKDTAVCEFVDGPVDLSDLTFSLLWYDSELSTYEQISSSSNLSNLNSTTGTTTSIISNIETFEADSFNSLSQNLDNSGLLNVDYSEILPFMSFATSTIMQFYNVLPSSFRIYISFIMGVGIILMLLSVGTFFVKKSGQQINTRDREVKNDMKRSQRQAEYRSRRGK